MDPELQKEIDRLKAENSKLTKDLSELTDELKHTRHEARDRRLEGKKLEEQVAALTTDRDSLKARAEADPEGLKAKVSDLTGKLRGVTHRTAFDKIATANKVTDPGRRDDLWALTGYKPEADEPDEAKLAETITGALKGRPWFLDNTAAPGGATTAPGGAVPKVPQPAPKPGPGGDRGGSVTTTSSSTPRNPNWPSGRL